MNLRQIKALLTVVDVGSFTKAAAVLCCTQSTVSHMVAELEKDWNTTLIVRSKSGVTLTEDGRRLMPKMREAVTACDRLSSAAAALKGDVRGTVRIGTIVSAATHVLPGIIRFFEQAYPLVRWELMLGTPDTIIGWVRKGRADLGVLDGAVPTDMDAVTLYTDELVAVLPENHPMAHKASLPEQTVNGVAFLLLADENGRSVVSDWVKDRNLTPDVRFSSWEDASILAMAEAGFGIGVVPRTMLRRTQWKIAVKPLDPPVQRRVSMVCCRRERLSEAAARFWRAAQDGDRK